METWSMNARWHQGHPMPKNATASQRVRWHLAHTKATFVICSLLGIVLLAGPRVSAQATQSASDNLIAIDVLLEPDETMVARANAVNARLRGDYPGGYSLDATHTPHVTMVQRFIRLRDFDAVTAAIAKVLATERPTDLQLTAHGLVAVPSAGVAVTLIAVERTPELARLQQRIADAVAPFAATGGTEAAFIDTPKGGDIVAYVETFVPKASGANYFPHITAGVASEAFVNQMKAEPFTTVRFKPTGVAIYQLGNFGTASKRLWPGNIAAQHVVELALQLNW
jgi:hypothetical protein